jgi:hypothetical protein
MRIRGFFRGCGHHPALACLFVLVSTAFVQAASYRLLSVEPSRTPKVQDNNVVYTLDIVFDSLPPNYSFFYSRNSPVLIIECYDAAIKADSLFISRRGPFKWLEVTNFNSLKSISGQQSRIAVALDSRWRADVAGISRNVMRISISKKTEKTFLKKKELRFLPYAAILLITGIITFIAIQAAQ